MSVNDLDSLPVRGIYGVLRMSLRAREVMRAVRGISALTVAAIVLAGLAVALRSYWLLALLAVMLLLNAAQWIYFRYYLARSGLEGVDEMTGWEFERWLEALFLRLGFEVERTPFRGDYGADFVLTWNGVRWLYRRNAARGSLAYRRCSRSSLLARSMSASNQWS
jgi:HJR/Mrr/RecB family endonuclease